MKPEIVSKRFTETEKWNDPWFRRLSPDLKCFWLYVLDNCDLAGVWKVDMDAANFFIGGSLTEEIVFAAMPSRFQKIDETKWHVTKFIKFQQGDHLNPKNNAHLGIIRRLEILNIPSPIPISPCQGAKVGLTSPTSKGNSKGKSTSFGKTENLFFGEVPDDLMQLASTLMPSATAGQWHDYVQNQIGSLGYSVAREVPCDLDDGTGGRIDLVARRGNLTIAIELDYRTARQKSIKKVKLYPAGIVLLRDPKIIEVQASQTLLARVRALFHKRDSTPLDKSEAKAWETARPAVEATSEEEWQLLAWAYSQTAGPAAIYRRKDMVTLLNNFRAEIDRARQWKQTNRSEEWFPKDWSEAQRREYREARAQHG